MYSKYVGARKYLRGILSLPLAREVVSFYQKNTCP
jgi:hypothetical protein